MPCSFFSFVNNYKLISSEPTLYLPLNPKPCSFKFLICVFFRITLVVCGIVVGFSLFHRTTNIWTLKNLGDSFLGMYSIYRTISLYLLYDNIRIFIPQDRVFIESYIVVFQHLVRQIRNDTSF